MSGFTSSRPCRSARRVVPAKCSGPVILPGFPQGFYSLTLTLSLSAVISAPWRRFDSYRARTFAQISPCSCVERFTNRMMPECGCPKRIASSPKSLSSVTRTRASRCAMDRISSSPGSLSQFPAQTTSWPAASNARTAPFHTQVSSRTFTPRSPTPTIPRVRGRPTGWHTTGRREYRQAPGMDNR